MFYKILSDANHDFSTYLESVLIATNNSLGRSEVLSIAERYDGKFLRYSVANQWFAVFFAFYPIEVMCVSVAKLMTVDRLAVFDASRMQAKQRKRVFRLQLVVTATVVLANLICILASWVASGYSVRNAGVQRSLYDNAAGVLPTLPANATKFTIEQLLANLTDLNLERSRNEDVATIHVAIEVQSFAEIIMLGIILAAYVIVAALCLMSLRQAIATGLEINKNAEKDEFTIGNARQIRITSSRIKAVLVSAFHMQGRVGCTVLFVFVTFVLRILLALVVAFTFEVNNFRQQDQNQCIRVCECGTDAQKLTVWFNKFPEIRLVVMLVCSPLALTVAWWGMTWRRELQVFQAPTELAETLSSSTNASPTASAADGK
jgi:hypothetical protein